MKNIYGLLFMILGITILPSLTSAHPGNTASDGCHYCRTNCDKWGVARNERHCHGGTTTISTETKTPVISTVTTEKAVAPEINKTTTMLKNTSNTNTYGSGTASGANNLTCGTSGTVTSTSCNQPVKVMSPAKIIKKKISCKKGFILSKNGKSCTKKK